MEKTIHYFEKPGEENTDKLIELVKIRREELGINHIVVASASGSSGVKLAKVIGHPDVNIVNITHHAGFKGGDLVEVEAVHRKELENMDVAIYAGSHSLSGVGRGISNKFGGITPSRSYCSDSSSIFSRR